MGTLGKNSSSARTGSSARGADPDGPSGSWRRDPTSKIVAEGITFDDVLLIPLASDIVPATTDVSARLTRNIALGIPLLSAPMDTVTESALAIALAQEGGIGIIHKNLSPEEQARQVSRVKRSANGVILDPITLSPSDTVGHARALMRSHHVSGFPVCCDDRQTVVGILTRRDLKFVTDAEAAVSSIMTDRGLVTAPPGTTLEQAGVILSQNKIEKLLLVDANNHLAGLITMRDIDRLSRFPRANVDARGRLLCGAAVGVDQFDRVEALIRADVDVIIVDTAHGHSANVIRTVRDIKDRADVEVIAGNIATSAAARDLVEAGADAIKVSIGPGSICTTRIVTGIGVPQISAILNAVEGVAQTGQDIPIIADGGIRASGDIAKAIAAGADAVMLGSLFAGLDESPGELVISQGRRYKSYRGMGSEGAMNAGSADRYGQGDKYDAAGRPIAKFVPEDVEGLVAYRGSLAEFVYQLVGGLRSAMGYLGCQDIADVHEHARFVRTTSASMIESHPHDIRITKESPNYMSDQSR